MTHAILPWPPKELSPNARVHWAKKARAAKEYKAECLATFFMMAREERREWSGVKSFKLDFHPPSNRRFDLDNAVARAKQLFDALVKVTGVDDSEFQFTISKAPPVKGGAVRVEAI